MSSSTETRCTHPQTQEFPGNCTLESALKTIVDVYHRYSSREGHMDLLSFNEFNTLMKEQASNFLQACNRTNGNYLANLFKETDINKDRKLTFEEFTIVLGKLTNDAHCISHNHNRCTPVDN